MTRMYKVSELLGSRIKQSHKRFGLWLLEKNLDNLVTDIGNVNYSHGEELLSNPLTPLSKPFCDNITFVKITDSSDCEEDNVKKDGVYLREKLSGSARSVAKLPFPLLGGRPMAERVRKIIGRDELDDIVKTFKNPIAIPYKVELGDVELATLEDRMPDILVDLRTHGFYLMDFVVTQDFAGIFNKKEMSEYLVQKHNFRFEGDQCRDNIIVKSDKNFDCLTWMTPSGARVKIYNKFVCQITSHGVNRKIGNRIVDFVNYSQLRQTPPLGKEHGVTRLEARIYYENDNHPLDNCTLLLQDAKRYFHEAPFYSVSIPKMWTKLTDSLQNSCCVVYNNLLLYVYWGNSNTKNLTGVQLTLPSDRGQRSKIINYVISAFSFNYLPVNYLEIVEDVTNKENINVLHKCYIKSGETFFSKSSTAFSTICKDICLEDCGLIPTNNVIPQILRKKTNVTERLQQYTLVEPLSTVVCTRKRKLELEEIDIKKRKFELRQEYQDLLRNDKTIKRARMAGYFNRTWKNLDLHTQYQVSAFTVNSKAKYTFVGILAEKEGNKRVYFLNGKLRPWLIEIFNNRKELEKDGFVVTPCNNGLDVVHLPSEEPIFTFATNGVTCFNNHSFANIENLKLLRDGWKCPDNLPFTDEEDMDQVSILCMQEIKGKIIPRQCHRLEKLEEGVELVVRGIKEIKYRDKNRYIVQFENLNDLFISNYWLEKEIKELNVDLNYKFNVKIDKLRTTVSKNKERLVFCK